jgi:hypothetical protein
MCSSSSSSSQHCSDLLIWWEVPNTVAPVQHFAPVGVTAQAGMEGMRALQAVTGTKHDAFLLSNFCCLLWISQCRMLQLTMVHH